MTESEATKIFKSTNCLLCQFPKTHVKSHHISVCRFLKRYDINCSYKRTTDLQIPKKFCNKVNDRRKKNAGLDAKDAKKQAEADKTVQAKKDVTIKLS